MLRDTRSSQDIAGEKPKPFLLKPSVARKRKPKGLVVLLHKVVSILRSTRNLQVIAGGKPKPVLLKASVARKRKLNCMGAERAAANRRPRREMPAEWVSCLN